MTRATESTPPSAKGRGRSLLVDLVVMGCTGAIVAFYAYHDYQTGVNGLTSLVTVTAIAVLIGTIALQLAHRWLSRQNYKAVASHHVKPLIRRGHLNVHSNRRGMSPTKDMPRTGRVRFSGRS